MLLEATLGRAELRNLIAEFSPLRIRLGPKGELVLGAPTEMVLVPDVGVRLVSAAHLSWDLLGISVPVSLNSLVLLVEPKVERRGDADVLVFKVHIESADLAMVPAMIADRVIEHVNQELVKRHMELPWNFTKTLSYVFRLPAAVENVETIGLRVLFGSLRIASDELVFGVSFASDVGRRLGRAEPAGTTGHSDPPGSSSPR